VKRLRILLIIVILAPILVWAIFGPGMRVYINGKSGRIIRDIETRSDGHVKVGAVRGDLWSGVTAERVIVYADKDPAHLPIVRADKATLRFSLLDLLRRDFTPTRIHVDGFEVALHIGTDGKIVLPQWTFRMSSARVPSILAGIAPPPGSAKGIRITCENGVLEIHKRFPNMTESVDVAFSRLEGAGRYVTKQGLWIDSVTGLYFTTPIEFKGYVPADSKEPMDLDADVGEVNLVTVFRDLDPLFRESAYLPEGKAQCAIHVEGAKDQISVSGALQLSEALLGNVKIDNAKGDVAYSAGVVDLTGLTADAYGGKVEGTGRINLLAETPIWSAKCTFDSVDLPAYLDENGYLKYEMKGAFSGSVDASGDFASADTMTCTTLITSSDGTFLSPFSDRFLSMTQGAPQDTPISPEDFAPYKELEVRARIEEAEIIVERFHFVSDDLQVEARGLVGFDKTVSAAGGLSVPLDRARRHPKIGPFVSFLPTSMSRVSLAFSVTGSVDAPVFSARPAQNLLEGLLDQGSDLAHDLGGAVTDNH